MAVASMKKVWLIAHRHDQPAIVTDLQEAGFIEIEAIDEAGPARKGADEELFAGRAEQLGLELTKVQFVLDFFKKAKPPKKGLIAGFVKDRLVVDRARFNSIDQKINFQELYLKCEEFDAALAGLQREQGQLKAEQAELESWRGLDARFDELKPSKYMGLAAGRVKRNDLERFEATLAEACPETEVAFVGDGAQTLSTIVLYFAPRRHTVEGALAAGGFEPAAIEGWSATPAEERDSIDARLGRAQKETRRIEGEITALLPLEDEVMIVSDWLRGRRIRYETQSRFAQTDSTFVLQGWIEEAATDRLSAGLSSHKAVIDFTFSDPGPDDKVPIVLRNIRWLRPFEVLTRLYGVPNYRELDPTPTMGIFFFIFFGIALGDFGYGLVLILFCLWLSKKLLLTAAGRLWLEVFALGGFSSMIFGVLTGSYFGVDIKSLPPVLRSLMVIDPLQQAFVFLMITWAIGVVQVMTGLILEFLDSWRHRDYSAAIYDNLSLMAVVVSAVAAATGWLAIEVFASKVGFYQTILSLGVQAMGISAVIYVLFSGGLFSGYIDVIRKLADRSGKRPAKSELIGDIVSIIVLLTVIAALFVRPGQVSLLPVAGLAIVGGLFTSSSTRRALGGLGSGLYNLYGLSSFIGDILSYSRLMALGLATFLIGFVINTLAGLVSGVTVVGLPVGILLALAIAIPLHIVNLVINLLGAFVHPLRLQFVEFFSKFYEDGGKAFRPFAFETDHLIVKEE
ncbi:MAG: V-type ATPase 116kDa subunit family protein [Actinomycetota bacterium]|nr:V-type ATPase 116kDa subunit family protein [Actinomycetota bacterium]